jgi:hypothetical protein
VTELAQLLAPETRARLLELAVAAPGPSLPLLAAERDAGLTDVSFVTIPDVEIAFVGMAWPASTGPTTLTFEHLADAARAANDDPHILPPRAKLGHTDPRFNEDEPVHDPFAYLGMLREDGTPAYGRYINLRLENDGASLRGDWVEVPSWLAEAAPSAYPSRSLEGDWDVETPGGKRYSFVLTAVAALGDRMPAIGCLEDLIRTLTGSAAGGSDQPSLGRSAPMATDLAASVDSVTRQFWNDFAQGDRYWWWPVDVWVDPNQVIADDDEGHLYRIPFSSDADGNVAFGDPVHVQQEFRDLPAVAASQKGQLLARFAAAASVRPADRVRTAAANTEQGDDVDEQTTPDLPDEAENGSEEETEETTPAADEETTDAADEPAEMSGVTVDREQYSRLQADARMGREAREQQLRTDREHTVDAAIQAGKFPPARRDHYLALLERDPDGTRTFIDELATGVIPVDERGVATTAAADVGLDRVLATLGVGRDRKERN